MDGFFEKKLSNKKIERINNGVWKLLGKTKKEKGTLKIEMRLI